MRYPYFWGTLLAFAASYGLAQAIVMIRVPQPIKSDVLYSTFKHQLALNPDMFSSAQYPWQETYIDPQNLDGGRGEDAKRTWVYIFQPGKD